MVANTPPTQIELQHAGTDIDVLDRVINGEDSLVETRRGGAVYTLLHFINRASAAAGSAEAFLADLAVRGDDIDLLVNAFGPGGIFDRLSQDFNSVISAGGIYPVSLGDYGALDAVEITDPRDTITRTELRAGENVVVRYRPRALPFTISGSFDADDWYEMTRDSGVPQAVLAELRRLGSYHPAAPPKFLSFPVLSVPAGTSGVLVDLLSVVNPGDAAPVDLFFYDSGTLPAGVTLSGSQITYTAPAVQAEQSVTIYVRSPTGQQDGVTVNITIYDPANPPNILPTWRKLPAIFGAETGDVEPLNLRSFLNAGTTPLHQLTIVHIGEPGGLDVNDGVISGVYEADSAGNYTVTWTAIDNTGATVTQDQIFAISAAGKPQAEEIPLLRIVRGQAIPPVRFLQYVTDDNTPLAEISVSVDANAIPPGTSVIGKELRGTPSAAGTYSYTVTYTNLANEIATATHTIRVDPTPTTPVYSGGSSGGGASGDQPSGPTTSLSQLQ